MMIKTSRKTFLRGLGAAALVGPFLRILERPARAATAPKRFVYFHTPNGTLMPQFWPGAGQLNLAGSAILSPLAPLQQKLLVLRGINMQCALGPPGISGHGPDRPSSLTGKKGTPVGSAASTRTTPSSISLDQYLANKLSEKAETRTKFKYLNLGVQSSISYYPVSATGPNAPVAYQNSPQKAYDYLFAGFNPGGGPNPADDKLKADRMSVLDRVKGDLAAVRVQLGTPEQQKFDSHLDAVRDLENSLNFVGKTPTACTKPDKDALVADYPTQGAQQMKLIQVALACDLTRVVGLLWSHGTSEIVHKWADPTITNGHHPVSHGQAPDATTRTRWLTAIEKWYATKFAELAQSLDAVVDVDGRKLLDNTTLVWMHEQSDGRTHGRTDMPYVMAGGCGGYYKTGRAIQFAGQAHNGLLISIANAMDVPTTTFGDPTYVNDAQVGAIMSGLRG